MNFTDLEAPPCWAVTVAVWNLLILLTLTVNVAEVAPPATVTEAGVLRDLLLSDKDTVRPPAGATWASVTVQLLLCPEVRLVGLHVKAESVEAGGATVSVALAEPPE